jgi:hypothetical protein
MHGQEDEKAGKQTCQQTTMKHNNAEFSHEYAKSLSTTQHNRTQPSNNIFFFKSQPQKARKLNEKVEIRVSSR